MSHHDIALASQILQLITSIYIAAEWQSLLASCWKLSCLSSSLFGASPSPIISSFLFFSLLSTCCRQVHLRLVPSLCSQSNLGRVLFLPSVLFSRLPKQENRRTVHGQHFPLALPHQCSAVCKTKMDRDSLLFNSSPENPSWQCHSSFPFSLPL